MTFDELRDLGERIRLSLNEDLQLSLDYDKPTVEWLDGYIDRNRAALSNEWALAFGYILGEAIVRVFGGKWVRDEQFEDEWVVELPKNLGKVDPIGKAYKHFYDPNESVLSLFRITGMAIEKGGFDKIGRKLTPE